MDRHRVPALDAVLRKPGFNPLRRTARRRRWLAPHRRPDESEVFPGDASNPGHTPCGDGARDRLCPVGTISEYLWKLGRKLFRRNFTVPRWLDIPLRSLKYILMAFFLFIVISMSAEALNDFMMAPFGIVADVKMLNFFLEIGAVGIAVLATLVVLSVFIQNFWCRFLCPYGALLGIVSIVSPDKIRRDTQACIDCGKCSKAHHH